MPSARATGVTLKNLRISECELKEEDAVDAVIEVGGCAASFAAVTLEGVTFLGNRNRGGSVGMIIRQPSCYRTIFENVSFENNVFEQGSHFSERNGFFNVTAVGNRQFSDASDALFSFPDDSVVIISILAAHRNRGRILRMTRGRINVTRASFSKNTVANSSLLYFNAADVSVANSSFLLNKSGSGGHIIHLTNNSALQAFFVNLSKNQCGHCIFGSNVSAVTLNFSSFEENDGGVFTTGNDNVNNGIFNMSHCHVSGNDHPKLILFDAISSQTWNGSVNIDSTVFTRNHGASIAIGSRGTGRLRFLSSSFLSNRCDKGCAVFIDLSGGAVRLETRLCRFFNNTAKKHTSAFKVRSRSVDLSTFVLKDTVFVENKSGGEGGSVHIMGRTTVDVKNVSFLDNEAGSGTAFFFKENTEQISIRNCHFKRNVAGSNGGVILARDTTYISVQSSRFIQNRALRGGALHLGSASIVLRRSIFRENTAVDEGGAVFVNPVDGELRISRSRFEDNSASLGGALSLRNTVSFASRKSSFIRNSATLYGGAWHVLYSPRINVYFENQVFAVSFEENRAVLGGNASVSLFLRSRNSLWMLFTPRSCICRTRNPRGRHVRVSRSFGGFKFRAKLC